MPRRSSSRSSYEHLSKALGNDVDLSDDDVSYDEDDSSSDDNYDVAPRRAVLKYTPGHVSTTPRRRTSYDDYARSWRGVPTRSNEQVQRSLRNVPWSTSGTYNSEAVIDAVRDATGFQLPVEDKYLKRLHKYKKQVLPYVHPTCPIGWDRHTSLPDKAKEMGVVWIDKDGYFCGPPGSDESTKYVRPADYEDLNTRVRDITTELKHMLEPEKYKKEKEARAKEIELRRERSTKIKNQRIAQKSSRQTEEDTRHKSTLTLIYKKEGGQGARDAKTSADAFYDKAKLAISGEKVQSEQVSPGIKRLNISSPNRRAYYIYVPDDVFIEDDEVADSLQTRLLAWWRSYHSQKMNEHVVAQRRNVHRMM